MRRKIGTIAAAAAAAGGLALAAPHVAKAYDTWQETRKQAWIEAATAALQAGTDDLPPVPWGVQLSDSDAVPSEEVDDAESRQLSLLLMFGNRTPEYQVGLMGLAQQENAKADAIKAAAAANPNDPAIQTVASTIVASSIGPAGARSEYNGSYYQAQDSGRVRAIRVHPTDPNTVYIATTGGGVWKTSNFHMSLPTWTPLTDGVLTSIDLGGMDIDKTNPLNIYVGTGEHGDALPGGAMMKSADGGATWQPPVLLTGTYVDGVSPATKSLTLTATQVRAVAVDPNNPSIIMATTDVGLFRSTDAGATYGIVDLPNLSNYTFLTGANATTYGIEGAYDITYLGTANGLSQWMVSGDYACPNGFIPSLRSSHVPNCSAATGGASPVTTGTFGDIWKSTDGGATWSSMRVAGLLPTQASTWGQTGTDSAGLLDMGRIGIAASPNADPTQATVYAMGASISDAATKTVLIFKTTNGGTSWVKLATPLSPVAPAANAVLTNPTTTTSCNTMDVGHGQAWYNLAIAADPGDPTRAIVGGNLCSYRTIDGGATWQLATYWLPSSGGGDTLEGGTTYSGPLPYAHADWHTATISRVGGRYVTFAGCDGGIFASYDVFDRSPTNQTNWMQPQYGLVTLLPYGHGTGDPVFGNANALWIGLQDNGTRWRLSHTENVFLNTLLNWDQIQGGDGTGNGLASDSNGQNQIYWAGLPTGPRTFCKPALRDCSRATTIIDGNESGNWTRAARNTQLPAGDSEPFTLRYSPTYDAVSSVISASTFNVWKVTVGANNAVSYQRLSPVGLKGPGASSTARNVVNQHVYASPWTYTINNKPTRLYGVTGSGGTFFTITDDGSNVFAARPCQTSLQKGGVVVTGSSSISFFKNPAHGGGTDPRDTYLVSTNSVVPGSASAPTMGHLFLTTDNGTTWNQVTGNGSPAPGGGTLDLPNVPIYVARIDYSDPTEKTWYVGTELGLYRTVDGGNTWSRYANVPSARVIDLTISLNGSLLRASTYGRGVWEAYPHSDQATATNDSDWDKNGVVDFRDLLAVSSRLGKTPAMNDNNNQDFPAFFQEPRYDAAVDADNSGTLDDTDLAAVQAKFGGAP